MGRTFFLRGGGRKLSFSGRAWGGGGGGGVANFYFPQSCCGGGRGGGGQQISFPCRAAVAAVCQAPPVSQRTKRRG